MKSRAKAEPRTDEWGESFGAFVSLTLGAESTSLLLLLLLRSQHARIMYVCIWVRSLTLSPMQSLLTLSGTWQPPLPMYFHVPVPALSLDSTTTTTSFVCFALAEPTLVRCSVDSVALHRGTVSFHLSSSAT
ncbi:hypothetical protein LY76DRAFT_258390 [Colletotrichum caudatum]|nr:hypothetical protein LY76DRAFT_258390 [Colletotrichum caudatum]